MARMVRLISAMPAMHHDCSTEYRHRNKKTHTRIDANTKESRATAVLSMQPQGTATECGWKRKRSHTAQRQNASACGIPTWHEHEDGTLIAVVQDVIHNIGDEAVVNCLQRCEARDDIAVNAARLFAFDCTRHPLVFLQARRWCVSVSVSASVCLSVCVCVCLAVCLCVPLSVHDFERWEHPAVFFCLWFAPLQSFLDVPR